MGKSTFARWGFSGALRWPELPKKKKKKKVQRHAPGGHSGSFPTPRVLPYRRGRRAASLSSARHLKRRPNDHLGGEESGGDGKVESFAGNIELRDVSDLTLEMFQRWKKESGDAAGDDPTLVDIPAFENQACFVRTRGAGARESWPEVLAWRTTDGERSFTLRRDKTCCYVSTDFWKIRRKTSFEVCDGDDVWLTCVLTPGDGAWTLECKIAEAAEAKGAQPRWEMNIEVSLVGKFQDCPCFLQEVRLARFFLSDRGALADAVFLHSLSIYLADRGDHEEDLAGQGPFRPQGHRRGGGVPGGRRPKRCGQGGGAGGSGLFGALHRDVQVPRGHGNPV